MRQQFLTVCALLLGSWFICNGMKKEDAATSAQSTAKPPKLSRRLSTAITKHEKQEVCKSESLGAAHMPKQRSAPPTIILRHAVQPPVEERKEDTPVAAAPLPQPKVRRKSSISAFFSKLVCSAVAATQSPTFTTAATIVARATDTLDLTNLPLGAMPEDEFQLLVAKIKEQSAQRLITTLVLRNTGLFASENFEHLIGANGLLCGLPGLSSVDLSDNFFDTSKEGWQLNEVMLMYACAQGGQRRVMEPQGTTLQFIMLSPPVDTPSSLPASSSALVQLPPPTKQLDLSKYAVFTKVFQPSLTIPGLWVRGGIRM